VLLQYLGKQKSENCVSTPRRMLFCQQMHKTQSCYHVVTDEPPFIRSRIDCMHQTKPRLGCYSLLSHTHRLPSLSWCRSLCQKWELFFVEPEVKSQWTVLEGYLTISTKNVSCYQTRCRRCYLPFTNTARACISTRFAQHSSTLLLHKTLKFISPELWPKRPELN